LNCIIEFFSIKRDYLNCIWAFPKSYFFFFRKT